MIPVGARVRLTVPILGWPAGTEAVITTPPRGALTGWDYAVLLGTDYLTGVHAEELEVVS